MREIKFRAWDKDKNVLLKSSWRMLISMTGCITWLVDHYDGNLNLTEREETDGNDRFELMQYTGLKDKNGVEIYEGDILKETDDIIGKVFWNIKHACYSIYVTDDYGSVECALAYPDNTIHSKCEVIGNIYENQELIKEG